MNNDKKPYKEPETHIEILNAQLRIAKWAARRILELDEKLKELDKKQSKAS
jgi:hypothetical protein